MIVRKPHPRGLVATGVALITGPLLFYQIGFGASTVVSDQNLALLEEIAYVILGLIFFGLIVALFGMTILLQNVVSKYSTRNSSLLERLSIIVSEKKSTRIIFLVALIYGLLFAFASSTLVFQPGQVISETYSVRIPSSVAVLCCGAIGQMPELIVYLTQNSAILMVPVNMILLFLVSWLVGLNAAIASFSYDNRPRLAGGRWMGGLGAVIGLFTVCPSCAGLFFLSIIGLGSAVGLALTISSLQTLFIAIGIPFLLIGPVLTTSRISETSFCSVKRLQPSSITES